MTFDTGHLGQLCLLHAISDCLINKYGASDLLMNVSAQLHMDPSKSLKVNICFCTLTCDPDLTFTVSCSAVVNDEMDQYACLQSPWRAPAAPRATECFFGSRTFTYFRRGNLPAPRYTFISPRSHASQGATVWPIEVGAAIYHDLEQKAGKGAGGERGREGGRSAD